MSKSGKIECALKSRSTLKTCQIFTKRKFKKCTRQPLKPQIVKEPIMDPARRTNKCSRRKAYIRSLH